MPSTETMTVTASARPRHWSSRNMKAGNGLGNRITFQPGPFDDETLSLATCSPPTGTEGIGKRPGTSPSSATETRDGAPPSPTPPLPPKSARRLLRRPHSHANFAASGYSRPEEKLLSLSTIHSCGEFEVAPSTANRHHAPAEQQPMSREFEAPAARFQRNELGGQILRDSTITGTTHHRREGGKITSKWPDEILRVETLVADRTPAVPNNNANNNHHNQNNNCGSGSRDGSRDGAAKPDNKKQEQGVAAQVPFQRPLGPTLPPSPVSSLPSPSPSLSSSSPPPKSASKNPALGIFNFFSRGRRPNAATLSPSSSMRTSTDLSTSSLDAASPSKLFIEPGGKGIVPQIDAPISASNGGDREVSVRCGGATLSLTVNNETNVVDLVRDCAAQSETAVNTATSTVVETYRRLGLERRLRPYERIRDVLGSWDPNSRDYFVVKPESPDSPRRLGFSGAPPQIEKKPPRGFVLHLYHSNVPGRWHKRFISLQENGQILSSKKQDHASSDKDTSTLCHLSDFDIYKPNAKSKLRPPKKYCYAIKSQQKSTVFMNTQNYVHFFSTDDPDLAHNFYSLVHDWRSWYLAAKISRAEKQVGGRKDGPPQTPPKGQANSHSQTPKHKKSGNEQNKGKASSEEPPYALGAFEPLLDLKRFDKPLDDFGKDMTPNSSQPSTLISRMAKAEDESGNFGAETLLGQEYDKLKQAQKEREDEEKRSRNTSDASNPFTEGQSLLNSGSMGSKTASDSLRSSHSVRRKDKAGGWFPSAVEHTAQQRARPAPHHTPTPASGLLHERERPLQQQHPNAPTPLLDFSSSKTQGPPQWSRQRPGHGVNAPNGVMLVDLATSSSGLSNPINHFPAPPRNLPGRRQGSGGPPSERDAERFRAGLGGNAAFNQRPRAESAAVAATGLGRDPDRRRAPTHPGPPPAYRAAARNGPAGPGPTGPSRENRQPRGRVASEGSRRDEPTLLQKGYDTRLQAKRPPGA